MNGSGKGAEETLFLVSLHFFAKKNMGWGGGGEAGAHGSALPVPFPTFILSFSIYPLDFSFFNKSHK